MVKSMAEFASNGKANAALTTGIIGTAGVGAALLNGDTDPDFYKNIPRPFSGSVYEITGTDIKVITIGVWD